MGRNCKAAATQRMRPGNEHVQRSQYVLSLISKIDQWLSANEYFELLTAMEKNTSVYPFYDLGYDSHCVSYHPSFIYSNPCPSIYFLRCEHLKNGTPKFGFPRIKNVSKEYTWKKQGFTTAIPKRCPCVRYITANCYLCGKGRNRVHNGMEIDCRIVFLLLFLEESRSCECTR